MLHGCIMARLDEEDASTIERADRESRASSFAVNTIPVRGEKREGSKGRVGLFSRALFK